jgi:NAD(P)-dependent dehydrogenase (short-subunit alcohol dehydrogenase family)
VRLAGEKALVTGSTAGIGRAIAVEFAREGAAVVVTGRDATRGAAVVAEITAAGGAAEFVAADIADETECMRLVATTSTLLSGLSILVNNAAGGDARDGPVGAVTTSAWEAILRVDLTAPFWLCRAALPHLQEARQAPNVNSASRQAERASSRYASDCAAQGGR